MKPPASSKKRIRSVLLGGVVLALLVFGTLSAFLVHKHLVKPRDTYYSSLNLFTMQIFDIDKEHVTGIAVTLSDPGCMGEATQVQSREKEDISQAVDCLNAFRFRTWKPDDYRPTHSHCDITLFFDGTQPESEKTFYLYFDERGALFFEEPRVRFQIGSGSYYAELSYVQEFYDLWKEYIARPRDPPAQTRPP